MENMVTSGTLMVLLILVIPGFIYGRAKCWVTQRQDWDESVTVVLYINLVRSLVIFAFMIPLGLGMGEAHVYISAVATGNPAPLFADGGSVLLTAVMLIASPALCGWLMGGIELMQVTEWIREFIGLPPISYSQAWDAAFARARNPGKNFVFILEIEKKKGGSVYGLYGAHSAASRSGGYRDVYLENTWGIQNGALCKISDSAILVRGAEIASVRFIRIPTA